jgi:hypothetical protein
VVSLFPYVLVWVEVFQPVLGLRDWSRQTPEDPGEPVAGFVEKPQELVDKPVVDELLPTDRITV